MAMGHVLLVVAMPALAGAVLLRRAMLRACKPARAPRSIRHGAGEHVPGTRSVSWRVRGMILLSETSRKRGKDGVSRMRARCRWMHKEGRVVKKSISIS